MGSWSWHIPRTATKAINKTQSFAYFACVILAMPLITNYCSVGSTGKYLIYSSETFHTKFDDVVKKKEIRGNIHSIHFRYFFLRLRIAFKLGKASQRERRRRKEISFILRLLKQLTCGIPAKCKNYFRDSPHEEQSLVGGWAMATSPITNSDGGTPHKNRKKHFDVRPRSPIDASHALLCCPWAYFCRSPLPLATRLPYWSSAM